MTHIDGVAHREGAPSFMEPQNPQVPALPEGVLVIRPGRGANCSSVGSVIDMLFVSGIVGGALLIAVNAALSSATGERADERESDAGEASGGGVVEGEG